MSLTIYNKKPLTIKQQIEKLDGRGLKFDDKELAANYLSNISYYRLRAYTYPFQDNTDPDNDHHFTREGITFNDIIQLYCFDRRLRSLVFNALEKIEVAVRTKIIYTYSIATGDSHWYVDDSVYSDADEFQKLKDEMGGDIDRSNEDFIKHYDFKYDQPEFPPSWMGLEVVSFGTLSKLYEALDKSDSKKEIAYQFGLGDIKIMENWLHALSNLRNCCAHHSRIWNRRFMVHIKMPYNTKHLFMDRDSLRNIKQNKLFALLSAIKYLSDIISPNNSFKANLIELMKDGGKLLNLKDMGFPHNWKYLGVWR